MSRGVWVMPLLLLSALAAAEPISWFPELTPLPHSVEFSISPPAAVDYQLGLGALQKIGGRWRHKHEERVQGELARYTWQINEDYTATEGLAWLQQQLSAAQVLYQCEGRSCGSSAQWANRVFQQRVLYGHDERQQYVVLRLEKEETTYTLVLYAADRANRRHYVHLDVLRHDSD
ncbi:MAG: DUF4892 domain-containing protein [Gammaproteobacteria bacterium]|nr:DUF4892 domain-containing protein [Gammaproteobacteria bacterium]